MTLGVFSVDDRVDDAVLMASLQGAFFGANLRPAQIEGLIAAHVPRKHIAEIADTYDTKWWDYRRLSPGHSFLLFAHHYYQASKIAARKFLAERRRAQASTAHVRGAALVGLGIFDWKVDQIWDRDAAHITGMWNAMKMADALGIPYDQYCRLGNQVAIDTMWTRVPKPAQLYGTKLGAQVLDRWEKLAESRLFTARHPLYATVNFAGLPVQEAYRAWLLDAIDKRGDPTTALATVVYRTPQLPEDVARKHYPAASVNRARLIAA